MILHEAARRGAAEALATAIARAAIACGGAATGEHGIGLHRKDLLLHEHGEAVRIMRAIKQALDPLDL